MTVQKRNMALTRAPICLNVDPFDQHAQNKKQMAQIAGRPRWPALGKYLLNIEFRFPKCLSTSKQYEHRPNKPEYEHRPNIIKIVIGNSSNASYSSVEIRRVFAINT